AGTGEPGITIASIVKKGRVVITDLSEGMLQVAQENAAKHGIKNIEPIIADVCNLPFADNSFDAISCRFGFMFFPDMLLAAKEMVRVLKPGGRLATAVWAGPEQNFWVTATMAPLNKNMQLSPPPPGAPGILRCAQPNLVADLFKQAGLRDVAEIDVPSKFDFGTAELYWNFMTDVVAPVVAALSKADEATRNKIKSEVLTGINEKYPSGKVAIDASAILIYGQK
ncbi:MAG TPA: class I SAM-dependent methyltransferase, partial [Flavipsychrobacter sp.]|nr:class I SAM-dependent methyltransferase [Flavipsychrobacter sp.]